MAVDESIIKDFFAKQKKNKLDALNVPTLIQNDKKNIELFEEEVEGKIKTKSPPIIARQDLSLNCVQSGDKVGTTAYKLRTKNAKLGTNCVQTAYKVGTKLRTKWGQKKKK